MIVDLIFIHFGFHLYFNSKIFWFNLSLISEAPFGGGGGQGWANAHPKFFRGAQASTTKGPLPAIIIHYVQHNPFCPIDLKLLHAYYFHRRIVYLNKKVSR